MLETVGYLIGGLFQTLVTLLFSGRPTESDVAPLANTHPGAVVLGAELVSWPGLDQREAAEVRAVIADRKALSFRDPFNLELLRIPAEDVIGLEVVGDAAEYIRAVRRSGEPIDFWVDARHGPQAPSRNHLAQALGLSD